MEALTKFEISRGVLLAVETRNSQLKIKQKFPLRFKKVVSLDGSNKKLSPLERKQMDFALSRRRPVTERFNVRLERNLSEERMKELEISKWKTWESGGKCSHVVDYFVDEEIYIISGILRVTPFEYDESMVFEAGDYVRFPKWLVTKHDYDGEYKQKYRFIPYGEQ